MPTNESIKAAQQRMEQFTIEFPPDLLESLQIAEDNEVSLEKERIQNIVICGMGGSGIGGMIARDILADELTVPIEFCKSYEIPAYVNDRSLVICSSYSGYTEETLTLFNQAAERKAQIISICSGGILYDRSKRGNYQVLTIPGGKQPRAAVGLSLVQQLHILGTLFLSKSKKEELFIAIKTTAQELKKKTVSYQKNANEIASDLHLKHINVFTDTPHSSIGIRFTQQINENVKKKAHLGIIPEMNHNQLVGFVDYSKLDTAIFINSDDFNTQNKKRCEFLKLELNKYNCNIIDVNAEGNSNTAIFLKTIYLLDLISIELAKMNNVDPEEIEVIQRLKGIITK